MQMTHSDDDSGIRFSIPSAANQDGPASALPPAINHIPDLMGATAADKVVYCLTRAFLTNAVIKDMHKDEIAEQCELANIDMTLTALTKEKVIAISGRGRRKPANLKRFYRLHKDALMLRSMFEKARLDPAEALKASSPQRPVETAPNVAEKTTPPDSGRAALIQAVKAFLEKTDDQQMGLPACFERIREDLNELESWLNHLRAHRSQLENVLKQLNT